MNILNKSLPILARQITKYRSPCFRYLSEESPKPFNAIPGLKALPIIGIMHHFLPVIGAIGAPSNFFNMVGVLHKKYGPVVKMEGMLKNGTMLLLYEPEQYDKIYRAEESPGPTRRGFEALEYYRQELRKERFDGIYGLTTAQGAQWREFRTKVNPALLKPKLVKLYKPGLEEIAQELIDRLKSINNSADLAQNFEKEVTKWSLESIGLVALGTRIGCLKDNLEDDHPSKSLMYCSKTFADLSMKLEFTPHFWKSKKSAMFKKVIEIIDLQWDVSTMYIEQAKTRIRERGYEVPEEDQSVLEKLLVIDETVAVLMANEMLFAGIDTVTYTTIGLLYHLAINQEAQEKVREEIRAGQGARYLKACLKESLRLLPVLPANLRETTKEYDVGGYHIPKGVFVIAPHEYLSKLEKHYPRPLEFIPERWFAEKSDPLYHGNTHPMVTQPFGFGVRSCIGRRIAELEIEVLTRKILEQMKVEWTGPPIEVITKLINEFKKPLYFKLTPFD